MVIGESGKKITSHKKIMAMTSTELNLFLRKNGLVRKFCNAIIADSSVWKYCNTFDNFRSSFLFIKTAEGQDFWYDMQLKLDKYIMKNRDIVKNV